MKKIYYIILTLLVFTTTAGFRGCDPFLGAILAGLTGLFIDYPHSGQDNAGVLHWGIAIGDNGKVYTTDDRPPAPWILRPSGVTQNLKGVKGFYDSDSTIAYAVGDQGVILRSADKGYNWTTIRNPNQNLANLNGLDIISPLAPLDAIGYTNFIAVGNSGTVLKSSNTGGNWSWINLSINTTKKLNSVAVVNAFVFAVVGDSGAIYRTIDGGANWENRSISPSISLKKVVSTRYDRYCAVGSNGSIYTSTDYGYSWVSRSSATTRTFRDVLFSGLDSACAVGDLGTVRLTTNGGVSWYTDSYSNSLTTKNIISVARVDQNTVNSITSNTTPEDNLADSSYFLAISSEPFIGIEPITNLIAEFFSLKQNYPNPFNPITKISFDIPAAGRYQKTKITIYNALGKEMAVVADENLRPGQYEVEWDASNYPSGVYFYSIVSGEFKETKKMMLVK